MLGGHYVIFIYLQKDSPLEALKVKTRELNLQYHSKQRAFINWLRELPSDFFPKDMFSGEENLEIGGFVN